MHISDDLFLIRMASPIKLQKKNNNFQEVASLRFSRRQFDLRMVNRETLRIVSHGYRKFDYSAHVLIQPSIKR
jgi:hypothetical protein